MEHEATLNVRMPAALKRGGSRVLQENGMSPTLIVRKLYAYMDREGHIPECFVDAESNENDLRTQRRAIARSVAGSISLPNDFDVKHMRTERKEKRYGQLL